MSNITQWYGDVLNRWAGDRLGRKPTAVELNTVHMLGLRPGKQALANAMYLRPAGATQGQVIQACGAPQLNRMRGLVADGLVKRVPMSAAAGHTVYRIEITAKGLAKVTKASAVVASDTANGEAKPVKPVKRKPKAAKPASEPAPVTDAPAVQPVKVQPVDMPEGAPVTEATGEQA
jgi:hypothetical protein